MNVEEIHLNEKEQEVFDKFGDDGSAELMLAEFEVLRHTGLIQDRLGNSPPGSSTLPASGKCWLSGDGEKYRRYYRAKQKEARTDERRYRITTGISITALVISAGSLIVAIIALILR